MEQKPSYEEKYHRDCHHYLIDNEKYYHLRAQVAIEKYFEAEVEVQAGDVMSKDVCVMSETATLLEIVFALSVKHYPKAYITRDNKLVGVVDRITVVDRILNL